MLPDQKPGGRGNPLKNHHQNSNFGGGSSGGVLFLPVLDQGA